LFDRPKPTVGCSANGRRRRRRKKECGVGAGWTDHVRNEEVLLRVKEQRNILQTIKRRMVKWIGHILRRNCLLANAEVVPKSPSCYCMLLM